MSNGTVNPYEYYRSFSDPYSTGQAYTDIGIGMPTEDFLGKTDPKTGLRSVRCLSIISR